jgi:hypothetical protein
LTSAHGINTQWEGETPPAQVEWKSPVLEDGCDSEKKPRQAKGPQNKGDEKSIIIEYISRD